MSQDNTDYEKKIAQANAARQRQIERQREKLACPNYQKEQQAKQQASQKKTQQRSYERMQERMADPRYMDEQKQKKYESQYKLAEKQREQLQIREASPEYIVCKKTKPFHINISSNKSNVQKELKINSKQAKPIKSKGAKGRSPTADEKRLANKIGDIGCICCLNKKWYTSDMQQQETTKFISLHHVDGRTKEWAHAKVLPLCAYHHDTPAPSDAPNELTPIHRGNKKEWVKLNGTEDELLKQVYDMINEEIPWLTSAQ